MFLSALVPNTPASMEVFARSQDLGCFNAHAPLVMKVPHVLALLKCVHQTVATIMGFVQADSTRSLVAAWTDLLACAATKLVVLIAVNVIYLDVSSAKIMHI